MILLGISALALSGCSTSQPEEAKESASASAMATASATESTSVEAVDPQAEFASQSASLMATACDDLDLYRKAWSDANPDKDAFTWIEPDFIFRDNFLNSIAIAASYDTRWTDALINFKILDAEPYKWIGENDYGFVSDEHIVSFDILESSCQIARAGTSS